MREALSTRARQIGPGVLVSSLSAAVAYGLSVLLPGVSALLIAIILGVVTTNLARVPAALAPGIDVAAKKLLRAGIVFLGLQLVIGDILALGWPVLVVVVCVVAGGIVGTMLLGKVLRVRPGLALLIACGFSICGAAAVAGAAGVIDPDDEAEEDTVTAVALVVIFGSLMIAVVPMLAGVLGMDALSAGLWAGGSIHEIAQVVAAAGLVGEGALAVAVVVKLARVLMLAPVVAVLSIRQRRRSVGSAGKMPPIVPLFIVGFLAMMLMRSFVPLPDAVISMGGMLQTGLLAAAMFALGCGVNLRRLARGGMRPFLLAASATLLVAGIAFAGFALV